MSTPIELCRDLTVTTPRRAIVSGLTLRVAPGEVVALMGPSGAGKSVLSEVLFGLYEPGKERWTEGVEVSGTVGEARRRGALVPQFGGGLDHLWDWENIALAQREPHRPSDAKETRAHSGGERRAMLVARGVAAERELLWLDEPAAGLDPAKTQELAERLRALADSGLALVVTTHRVPLAEAIADRVVWLGGDGAWEERPTGDAEPLQSWLATRLAAVSAGPTGIAPARVRYLPGVGAAEALAAVAAIPAMLRQKAGVRFAGRSVRATWALVLARGAVFHAIVGAITAAIIYYSVRGSGGLTSAVAWIPPLGMNIVLRVTQPLAAILAAASAGAAVSSWIGQLVANRELRGLEVLDVDTTAVLRGPVTLALATAVALHTAVFGAAMVATFSGFIVALSDAPSTSLSAFLQSATAWSRTDSLAMWLPKAVLYPLLVAGVSVAFAARPKPTSASVGEALTRGIVRATLLVVSIELALLIPQAL